MPDASPVYTELFCLQCCMRRPVTHDGAGYRCAVCRSELQAPSDPESCPRAADGRHNPFNQSGEGWRCSRCNAPVEPPAHADMMFVGARR